MPIPPMHGIVLGFHTYKIGAKIQEGIQRCLEEIFSFVVFVKIEIGCKTYY